MARYSLLIRRIPLLLLTYATPGKKRIWMCILFNVVHSQCHVTITEMLTLSSNSSRANTYYMCAHCRQNKLNFFLRGWGCFTNVKARKTLWPTVNCNPPQQCLSAIHNSDCYQFNIWRCTNSDDFLCLLT